MSTERAVALRKPSAAGAWARLRAKMAGARGEMSSEKQKRGRIRRHFQWDRIVAIVWLLSACVIRTLDPVPVELLRVNGFDLYQSAQPREISQYPVVIVKIDEESLASLGQWPWPRSLLAQLVDRLTEMRAAAVGFDIIFPEPDRMSPARVAETLPGLSQTAVAELRGMPSSDAVFARSLSRARSVLSLAAVPEVIESPYKEKQKKTAVAEMGGDPRRFLRLRYGTLVRNVPEVDKGAKGRGIILAWPETDGVLRRVPAVAQVGEDLYPAFAIEMLRVATGKSAYVIKSSENGIKSVVVAGVKIPTDNIGRIWIHYSPQDDKRFVSAKDVLTGKVPPRRIAGRLVLIGVSASAYQSFKPTPLGWMLGVEVHAQLLETILTNSHLSRPTVALGMELAATLVAGLLIIVLLPWLGASVTLVIFTAGVAGAGYLSWLQFTEERVLIDVTYATLSTLLIYSFLAYTNYMRTSRARKALQSAFGHYLAPGLVKELQADPERVRVGGESKEMTFLFCDVRGFTAVSEQYKTDPQGLTRLLNRFLTPMTDAIMSRRGTIDKYMGDSIMAFWNAPLDDEAHADHACDTALAMLDELETLNARLKAEAEEESRPFQPLKVGIGLNTGECVVGNMGSEQRFDYSVMGDAVNLASRLEGQTKTYRVGIIVGEDTIAQVNGYAALELDLIAVHGKLEAARVYCLLGRQEMRDGEAFKKLEECHGAMLAAYRGQDWRKASELASECRAMNGGLDALYDLYQERIAIYEQEPPRSGWDGVFIAQEK